MPRPPGKAPHITLYGALPPEPVRPSTPEQNEAYRSGICKTCLTDPRRAGSTECESCYTLRVKGIASA